MEASDPIIYPQSLNKPSQKRKEPSVTPTKEGEKKQACEEEELEQAGKGKLEPHPFDDLATEVFDPSGPQDPESECSIKDVVEEENRGRHENTQEDRNASNDFDCLTQLKEGDLIGEDSDTLKPVDSKSCYNADETKKEPPKDVTVETEPTPELAQAVPERMGSENTPTDFDCLTKVTGDLTLSGRKKEGDKREAAKRVTRANTRKNKPRPNYAEISSGDESVDDPDHDEDWKRSDPSSNESEGEEERAAKKQKVSSAVPAFSAPLCRAVPVPSASLRKKQTPLEVFEEAQRARQFRLASYCNKLRYEDQKEKGELSSCNKTPKRTEAQLVNPTEEEKCHLDERKKKRALDGAVRLAARSIRLWEALMPEVPGDQEEVGQLVDGERCVQLIRTLGSTRMPPGSLLYFPHVVRVLRACMDLRRYPEVQGAAKEVYRRFQNYFAIPFTRFEAQFGPMESLDLLVNHPGLKEAMELEE